MSVSKGKGVTIDPEFAKFQQPAVAVDVILFTVRRKLGDLRVGLFKRQNAPHKGKYAIPGRFVRYDEPIEETAAIALREKCHIDPDKVLLNQLYTFGQDLKRDTRIRTISVVYIGLVCSDDLTMMDNPDIEWKSVYDLPELAWDHADIVAHAVKRLRNKVIWDKFIFGLMPPEFTLTELQKTFEIILDEELDKRNFRKKIAEQDVVIETGKQKRDGVHRPAMLYKLNQKSGKFGLK